MPRQQKGEAAKLQRMVAAEAAGQQPGRASGGASPPPPPLTRGRLCRRLGLRHHRRLVGSRGGHELLCDGYQGVDAGEAGVGGHLLVDELEEVVRAAPAVVAAGGARGRGKAWGGDGGAGRVEVRRAGQQACGEMTRYGAWVAHCG